jgi:hypothetical protein
MPCVFNWRGKEILLCSVFDSATELWQPAHTDWNIEDDPLHLFKVDDAATTVCNLYAYVIADTVFLSYVTKTIGSKNYGLYQTQTKDFIVFSPTQIFSNAPCWTGYVTPQQVVTAELNKITVAPRTDSPAAVYVFNDFETIFRVCPAPDDKVLITAMRDDQMITYIFDPENFQAPLQRLRSDDLEIYKSFVYKSYLVVAKRADEQDAVLNHRKLFYTQSFTTVPEALNVQRENSI